MEQIIYFCFAFLLMYMIYYFFSIRKAKKSSNRLPIEVQYLILRYQIDIRCISYRNFLNVIAIVGSFDVALVATIVSRFQGVVWQILFGFVFLVPIIVISFLLIGKYYQTHQSSEPLEEKRTVHQKKTRKGEQKNGK